MANEIENHSVFIKEEDRPGRIIKTIHSTLKTDCILQGTSIKGLASFIEKDSPWDGTCNCIESMNAITSHSTFSVYKSIESSTG